MNEQHEEILTYWFGVGNASEIPTPERTALWFGESENTDKDIKNKFETDIHAAGIGEYDTWEAEPRSSLALIILLDIFPRKVYRQLSQAYTQDVNAVKVCLNGLEQHLDHRLSLIERVFYYMPLLHTEKLDSQRQSIALYRELYKLSVPETKELYNTFLSIAVRHFEIIQKYGRFPDRNIALNRESSAEEKKFLKSL